MPSYSDSFRNVTRYQGQDYRFAPTYVRNRDPTPADTKPKEQQGFYPINSFWSNSTNGNAWVLVKYHTVNNVVQAIWSLFADSSSSGILQFTGGTGTAGAFPVDPNLFGQVQLSSNDQSLTITGSLNSVDFSVNGGAFKWNVVNQTNAPTNLVVDNGYICTSGGTGNVTFALPTTSIVGNMIEVVLDSATSWTITQGAGQQIRFGNTLTTSGALGSLASNRAGDAIRLVCEVANTFWIALSSIGSLTVT